MRTGRALPVYVSALLCVVMVVVLVAAGVAPASAQGNPPLWFQFNVGSVDPAEETTHVSVVLRDQPQCGGGFQVYSAESWSYWGAPTQGDPFGRSTDIGADIHMWAAELVPGAYYVHLGSGASPNCVLGVSGKAVDYVGVIDRGWRLAANSQPSVKPVEVAAAPSLIHAIKDPVPAPVTIAALPVPDPAPAAPNVTVQQNMNHKREMAPNEWMPVTSNSPTWFKFDVGHAPDKGTTPVSVTLYSGPFRTGHFEIFTSEGKAFDLPEHDDCFGDGDSVDGEYAAWHGDLVPGAYYVLVYPEGMKDCMLAVSGAGVTF